MLTSLTTEQWDLLHQIEKQTLDKFYNWGKVDETEIEKAVEKLYSYAKLEKPKIIYWKKGTKISLRGSSIDLSIRSSIYSSVDFSKNSSIYSSIYSSVDSLIYSSISSSLQSLIRSSINSSIYFPIDFLIFSSVNLLIRSSIYSSINFPIDSPINSSINSLINSLRWFREDWWTQTYMNFLSKIIPNFPKDFEEYRKIYDAGFLCLYLFKDICIVVKMPEKIERIWLNDRYVIHSTKKEAIDISGIKLYFLYGIKFEKPLWEKIVSGKMSFKEIMAIKNTEQRMAALKLLNPEKLLAESGAKLLDKSERGNELYLIKGIFSQEDAYFLKFTCPSTGRIYIEGVDPEFAKKHPKADECQSKNLKLTLKEYNSLKIET